VEIQAGKVCEGVQIAAAIWTGETDLERLDVAIADRGRRYVAQLKLRNVI
jgi:hypothetical protein